MCLVFFSYREPGLCVLFADTSFCPSCQLSVSMQFLLPDSRLVQRISVKRPCSACPETRLQPEPSAVGIMSSAPVNNEVFRDYSLALSDHHSIGRRTDNGRVKVKANKLPGEKKNAFIDDHPRNIHNGVLLCTGASGRRSTD